MGIGRSYTRFFQVLTGETPFRDIQQSALAFHVLRGKRPDKPENATAIGFSDSLWRFTQRCWHRDVKSRPVVGEVVSHLKEAAANWDGLMPPHVQENEDVASSSRGMSASNKPSGFEILILP